MRQVHHRRTAAFTLAVLLLLPASSVMSCRRAGSRPAPPPPLDLLAPEWSGHWRPAGIPDEGAVTAAGGELTLAAGAPMTGAVFATWQAPPFPLTNYRIDYEAMRVEGSDAFGMVTFPVNHPDVHATFVLGGWGGTVTGISSIDHSDANENQTHGEQRFADGVWHQVRVEIREHDLQAWVNGRIVVNVSIKGRHIGLRPGFIDHCRPFGFATYATSARIRGVTISRL